MDASTAGDRRSRCGLSAGVRESSGPPWRSPSAVSRGRSRWTLSVCQRLGGWKPWRAGWGRGNRSRIPASRRLRRCRGRQCPCVADEYQRQVRL